MRLLFVVSGVGYGDATREHANIEAFLKKNPKTKVLIAGYNKSFLYFRNKFPTVKISGYKLPGKRLKFKVLPFLFKNYLLPILWTFSTFKLRKVVKKFDPDIVISDFEPTGIALAKLIKKKCVIIFGYDPILFKEFSEKEKFNKKVLFEARYFEKLYNQADLVIIPTITGVKRRKLIYTYVNPIIRKKPSRLPPEKVLMKKLGLKKKPIFVMLGGSNFGFELAKNLNKIAHDFDENFIIFGGDFKMQCSPKVKHYTFKPNILEYLKVSKAVITLAGQKTLTECVLFKKPMLIFPIRDHVEQMLNAYAMKDYAIIGESVKAKKLKVLLKEFFEKIDSLQKKVSKLKVEFNGSEEVVKIVNGILKE